MILCSQYLLEKARQKGQHDNSFSAKIIQTLFCNIEDILALHRQLIADLESCMGAGASSDATIAQCYLKHVRSHPLLCARTCIHDDNLCLPLPPQKERFNVYKQYGENNEHSQKLLYELEEQPAFKAFFVVSNLLCHCMCCREHTIFVHVHALYSVQGCMLLGGKGDRSIDSYLFKPIQRVCKYPLLFRVSCLLCLCTL